MQIFVFPLQKVEDKTTVFILHPLCSVLATPAIRFAFYVCRNFWHLIIEFKVQITMRLFRRDLASSCTFPVNVPIFSLQTRINLLTSWRGPCVKSPSSFLDRTRTRHAELTELFGLIFLSNGIIIFVTTLNAFFWIPCRGIC